jgi:hypothetical protein
MKESDPVFAAFSNHTHRFFNFAEIGHSGGHKDRETQRPKMSQKGKMGNFEGSNLERRNAKPYQDVGTFFVEGRGEKVHAAVVTACLQVFQPSRRQFHVPVQVMHGAPELCEAILDSGLRQVDARGDFIRREELELDGIGARSRCQPDHLESP